MEIGQGPDPIGLESLSGEEETPGMHVHGGKATQGRNEKVAIRKPRREASGETKPDHAWVVDFQPQHSEEYISVV